MNFQSDDFIFTNKTKRQLVFPLESQKIYLLGVIFSRGSEPLLYNSLCPSVRWLVRPHFLSFLGGIRLRS